MLKTKKGFTVLETLAAITLSSIMIIGFMLFLNEREQRLGAKVLSSNMALLLEGIDKRLELEAYSTANWKQNNWPNYDSVIKNLVAKELRTKDSKCGLPDGWNSEYLQSNIELIPCDYWNTTKLPYKLQASASYKDNSTKKPGATEFEIQYFNVDYYFNNRKDYTDNIKFLVAAKNNAEKFDDGRSLTLHTYTWLNRSTNEAINLNACQQLKENCALRTQIEIFTGISTDKVRIDGKNDVMGEIDFDTSASQCTSWTKTGGVWNSTPIKCTLEAGFNSKTGSKVISYTNSAQMSNRISLEKSCTIYASTSEVIDGNAEKWKGAPTIIPCGYLNDNNVITVGVDEIHAQTVMAENFIIDSLVTNKITVKNDAHLYSNLEAVNLLVPKSISVTNNGTITGSVNTEGIINILPSSSTSVVNNLLEPDPDKDNPTPSLDARMKNLSTTNLKVGSAGQLGALNVSGVSSLSTVITPKFKSDARTATYLPVDGESLDFTKAQSGINNIDADNTFYSGYNQDGPAGETIPNPDPNKPAFTDKPIHEDVGLSISYNILKLKNLSANGVSTQPKVTGSTKSDTVIKNEMGNAAATGLDIAIYRDAHTFYSDPNSTLVVKNLISEGDLFNTTGTVGNYTKAVNTNYGVQATNLLAPERITINATTATPLIIKNQPVNGQPPIAASISNTGVVSLYGVTSGANSTAEVIFNGLSGDQDSLHPEGLRTFRFYSHRTQIITGTTRVYGNVVQYKPFHVNGIYYGNDIADYNGLSLKQIWNMLNATQSNLQKIDVVYQQVLKKLPPQRGAKGETGEKGFRGSKGDVGFVGSNGVQGPRGPMQYYKTN